MGLYSYATSFSPIKKIKEALTPIIFGDRPIDKIKGEATLSGLFYYLMDLFKSPDFKNMPQKSQKDILIEAITHFDKLEQDSEIDHYKITKIINAATPNMHLINQDYNDLIYFFQENGVNIIALHHLRLLYAKSLINSFNEHYNTHEYLEFLKLLHNTPYVEAEERIKIFQQMMKHTNHIKSSAAILADTLLGCTVTMYAKILEIYEEHITSLSKQNSRMSDVAKILCIFDYCSQEESKNKLPTLLSREVFIQYIFAKLKGYKDLKSLLSWNDGQVMLSANNDNNLIKALVDKCEASNWFNEFEKVKDLCSVKSPNGMNLVSKSNTLLYKAITKCTNFSQIKDLVDLSLQSFFMRPETLSLIINKCKTMEDLKFAQSFINNQSDTLELFNACNVRYLAIKHKIVVPSHDGVSISGENQDINT